MKPKLLLIMLVLAGLLPLVSLLHSGLPVTHDGQDHVVRIANFYTSLKEGNIIPRWGNNLNWGFGHPVLMFLYPLPSYVASLFHLIGFSFIDSTKLVFAACFILSIFTMYLWGREEFGEWGGEVSALLYGYAPYRFVDLYVRGAFGEHVAFVFLPLILYGLKKMANRNVMKGTIVGVIGVSGLLLSHNAISLMMVPIAAIYWFYLLFTEVDKKKIFCLRTIWCVLLGFGIASFFWVPALIEGKYTLRDIVTKGEVLDRMVPFNRFFMMDWNYGGSNDFSKSLGFTQLLMLVASFLSIFIIKDRKNKAVIIAVLVLIFLSLFFMTSLSSVVWSHITLMQNFQFPWRLLTVSVLLTSILGGIVLNSIPKKYQPVTTMFIALSLCVTTYMMWKPVSYKNYNETFFTNIYNGTTDTGESSPIWSVRFMEFRPTVPMDISEGKAEITPLERNTTKRIYTVNVSDKARLVENTLYFPGWHVYVDQQEVPLQFQDPQWRGRMTFWVEPGKHTVDVLFKNTKLRTLSNIITVLSTLLLIGTIGFYSKKSATGKKK